MEINDLIVWLDHNELLNILTFCLFKGPFWWQPRIKAYSWMHSLKFRVVFPQITVCLIIALGFLYQNEWLYCSLSSAITFESDQYWLLMKKFTILYDVCKNMLIVEELCTILSNGMNFRMNGQKMDIKIKLN